MNTVKEILISKQAFRLYWQIGNGFIGVAILLLAGLEWYYAPIIIAVLNSVTKEINNNMSK